MTNNFSAQYSSLPHTFDFKNLDLLNELEKIKIELPEDKIRGKTFYLSDELDYRFALTFLWLLDNGATPIAINPEARNSNISSIVNTKIINENASQTSNFEGYICLTSGTTGLSTACNLTIAGAKKNALAHIKGFELSSNYQIIQCLPTYHSFGIIAYIWTPLLLNCGVHFTKGVVGLRYLKNEKDLSSKIIHLSPSQMRFILKDKESSNYPVGKITIGAGSVSKEEIKKLINIFPSSQIYTSYGATELGPRVSAGKIHSNIKQDGFIGNALESIDLRILKNSKMSATGKGRLLVKTPSLKINIKTEEIYEGYYLTRDIVEIMENGDLYFISREDDIIKKGGISLYPVDIESILNNIDQISDSLVLKKSHPLYEETPIFFLESKLSENELNKIIQDKIPSPLWPERIFVVEKFPRTSLGKIDRSKLKGLI